MLLPVNMAEAEEVDNSNVESADRHKDKSVQEMTNEELQTLVDEISASNATMQRENAMYDKYYERMVPKEEDQQLQTVPPELQVAQATLEEAECALTETKKVVSEFEHDIATFLQGKKESTIVTETLFKYFEDKIHAKEMLIDKLQLKNHAWKMLKAKMHQQLQLKEEAGEMLREVDFQQLKIENTQFLRQIEQYNLDLLQLKVTTGKTQIVLNSYKRKLQKMLAETKQLISEIKSRCELLQKIELETTEVEEDKAKAERLNRKFRNDISNYKVPDILEYVQETWNHFDLDKKMKTWERKVDVAELSYRTYSKTWEKIKKYNDQGQDIN
ncbi:coiled-coil domain-containing protein 113 isoform X2 [Hypanus sabinus]|uniref:coiled-coil domain-containing protein 113 isoform X2 n=1 Tax=Hypanus sabinus TaxID=79690 RepID=UPI0028C409CB|nr:coiled-coil domain-containing protein 113 isoform X2 [Hypanus sabinus]